MLRVEPIYRSWGLEDIFGDGQWCPVCTGEVFIHVPGQGVTCERCGAEFRLRDTAGDAGVVVECLPDQEGKYLVRVPTLRMDDGYAPYFSQVLKECESGLDDRDRWASNLVTGVGVLRYILQENAPVGEEVFLFRAREAGRLLAFERWLTRTEAGRAYTAHSALEPEEYGGDYLAERQRLWCAGYRYQRERTEVETQRLKEAGHEPGFYVREQCTRVFEDDGFYIHRCVPLTGEQPVRADPHR